MSLAQIAASDALVFGTALGWLLIIIFMVTMQRKLPVCGPTSNCYQMR